ncbi:hypothetical protein M413DRAFT_444569 [Hebeloma cylindrosporum]|uniref:Uncharacterized protein n=1 Tax=Hebeloma cylindrosporum TaxID=76867 RepID=A0A0C3CET7_HEBCY|nr:hypothetical protein M413DRAFT_444569 [Hebeloma cylindrosporum h7]
MPLIAGIAFSGLTANSPIFTTVLSTSDASFVQSSSSTLGDDLSSTAKSLFTSEPAFIKLALPSYLDRETRKPILQAFKQANLVFPSFSETIQLAHISLTTKDHAPRNEIIFHLSPTLAIGRLVSTSVEEGIRESTTLKEITFDSPSPDTDAIIAEFIDLAQATLDGTKVERIIVIDASVATTEVTSSSWNGHQTYRESPVELVKIGFGSVALQAAKSALASYQSALDYPGSHNVALARIGIVNADGFVHDFIPKHAVFPQPRCSATFTTSKDDQTEARVSVVIGESRRGEENLCVGQVVLRGLPKKAKGGLVIRVMVEVDEEGDISVTAEEAESGVSEKTVVRKLLGEHHVDELEEVLEKFKVDEVRAEAEVGNGNALPE